MKITDCITAGIQATIKYPEFDMEIVVSKQKDGYQWKSKYREHFGLIADEVVRCAWSEAVALEA